MAALLALLGAGFWGAGDFLGGLASRRIAVLAVLVVSQAVGLAAVGLWVVVSGDSFPGIPEILPAVGGGAAGLAGLAALYRGFAVGAMGIVAPISAAAPVVPLTVDAAHGTVPGTVQWLGVALVLVGIATLSYEPRSSRESALAAGAGLAVLAALGFGVFIVGIDAGADESAAWAVVAARATSVTLALTAALATSTSVRVQRGVLPLVIAVGVFDTGANLLVAAATTRGAAGLVAVLSALYPIVTVLLAWLLLRERLSIGRRLGGVLAVAGAALVAAG